MTSRLRVGDIVRLRNGRCTYTVTHVYPTYWNEKESVIVKSNNSGFTQSRRKSEDYILLVESRMRDIKKNNKTFLEHGWKPGDVVRLISRGLPTTYKDVKLYEEYIINPDGLISVCGRDFAGLGDGSEWERVKKAGEEDKEYVIVRNGKCYITKQITSDATAVYELGRQLSKKVEWV